MAAGQQPRDWSIPDGSGIDLSRVYRTPGAGGGGQQREPDYIPFNKKGRDIFSRLSQNTGLFWLGGFAAGGAWGSREGLSTVANATTRMKVNAIMNGVSRSGSKVGNALGVIACAHTLMGWVADEQLQLEELTGSQFAVPAFAGFTTGLIYKSTTTPRGAFLGGCIGLVASCAYGILGTEIYAALFRGGGRGRY